MVVTKELLSNFHNLKGFTVAEKTKSLFVLLNSVKSLDQNSLNHFISSVTPRDYFESIFQVEMLIQFRRTEDLFKVLKNESENLSAKIFKQPWFFQEPFTNLTAELIVNDLLPNLSFVTRNRVIKCLGKYHKDEIKCDQVFDKLLERYGINSAKQILRGCSIEKCQEVFKSHRGYIQLSSSDLIPLFDKDPHLFESYVELCDKDLLDGMKIIQEVILKEPDMYLNLRKKMYSTSLGKRSTRRLLIHSKEHIVSKASEFSTGLHLRTVYKFLGRKDAEIFLQNLFPKNQSQFSYYGIEDFLKHFPETERFAVFTNIFEKVYEKTVWDENNVLCDAMLEIIHNEEDRLKWMDLKIRSGSSPDMFYHFYEINKALGLIKEKINMTKKVNLRRELIEKLVFVCKFNNDVRALRDVLEYFCKHHKNEDQNTKNYFLRELDSSFDLTELSEEHWKFINEILHMQQMGIEESDKRKIILLKYVVYLWKNKRPIREKIVDLIQNENLSVNDWYSVDFKCIRLEKEMINVMEEILSQKTDDPNLLIEENLALLDYIRGKTDRKNEITLNHYPRLTSFIKTYVKKTLKDKTYNCDFHDLFETFVGTKEQDEFGQSITDIYIEYGLEEYTEENILLRYLKHDRTHLTKYADKLVKGLCSRCFKPEIWSYIKKLTYYEMKNLNEKSVQYCLKHYTEATDSQAKGMLAILAYLLRPEDYVALVSKHVPQVDRMDIEDEESKKKYHVEVAVASTLKITKSVVVLPTLISFCVGDCLRNALESLYYLFYHLPENKLDTFLKQFSNRAVSVRKHTFFLISKVGSAQSVVTTLKSAIELEKNASIQKHILKTTLRYFKKNPLDNFCELLISCIPFLDITDTESLRVIQSVEEVPEKFQGRYFVSILEYLKSLADKNHEASTEADTFLSKIKSSIMKLIPYDFCMSFIDKYFLKKDDCFSEENIEFFTRQFLFHCHHDFTEKLDIILKKLIEKKKTSEIGLDIQTRKNINAIISQAICHFTYSDDVAQLKIFYNRVFKFLEVDEVFENYVRLKCLLLKKESPDIVEFTSKMHPFFSELTAKYGSNITKTFASGIKECLSYSETKDDSLYKLCFEVWKNSKTVSDYLLIILLLPNKVPDKHHQVAFFQLLKTLESHPDSLVRITLNSYLQSSNLSNMK